MKKVNLFLMHLCAGACGYLVKKTPPARLLEAIKDANDGGSPMSSRIARQVITAFKEGKRHFNSNQKLWFK